MIAAMVKSANKAKIISEAADNTAKKTPIKIIDRIENLFKAKRLTIFPIK